MGSYCVLGTSWWRALCWFQGWSLKRDEEQHWPQEAWCPVGELDKRTVAGQCAVEAGRSRGGRGSPDRRVSGLVAKPGETGAE